MREVTVLFILHSRKYQLVPRMRSASPLPLPDPLNSISKTRALLRRMLHDAVSIQAHARDCLCSWSGLCAQRAWKLLFARPILLDRQMSPQIMNIDGFVRKETMYN